MKKQLIFLAAVMLLGVQNASAWGFKAQTWGGADGNFTNVATFYPDGYTAGAGLDVYAVTFDAEQTWFSVYQENDGAGQSFGFSAFSTTVGNGAIVRATAAWDDGLHSNYTVILPDGKIWVVPAGAGSGIEMTKQSNYIYTAVVPQAATVSLYGADITATVTEYGASTAGKPLGVKLVLENIPVTATAGKVKVTYDLLTNQVIVEDFVSEICNWPYTAPEQTYRATFTFETLANGNLIISIAPHPDNTGTANDYAFFRNEIATGNIKVNGNSGYFTTTDIPSNTDGITSLTYVPTSVIPDGAVIAVSGTVEYKTDNVAGQGNNQWPTITFPAYSYGSNCAGTYVQKLATPTNVSINAANALSFTEVANADNYIVAVSFGAAPIKTLNVSGSSETLELDFSGAFTVTVIASDSEGNYSNSEPSAPYSWNAVMADDTDLPTSIYCGVDITGVNGSTPNFSVETATNGDIEITINNGQTWRGQGVQNNFTVDGISGLLVKVSGATDNPQVFSPIDGLTIRKGAKISYNGTIEWNPNTGWATKQFFTDYIYGTNCADTDIPVVVSASITGDTKAWGVEVSVNATDNIGVTQIKLKDEANSYEQILPATTANGTATYLFNGLTGGTTYHFLVTALDLAGNESNPITLPAYITLATPQISVSTESLNFTPNTSIQTFTISGSNLTSPLTLLFPVGYTVTPATLTPAADGTLAETTVTVKWVDGSGLGNTVSISGGGLENSLTVDLEYTGFSQYCSYVLQHENLALHTPALLNIVTSEDNKTLTFTITGYEVTGDAQWNDNTLPLGTQVAPYFKINDVGVDPANIIRTKVDAHTVTITFATALATNDEVTFTGLLCWQTSGYTQNSNDGNVFINAWDKTYTVGADNCDCIPTSVTKAGGTPTLPATINGDLVFEAGASANVDASGSTTVLGTVGVEYTLASGRWYSVAFPFDVDYVYSAKLGGNLTAYDEAAGGHFYLKTYNGGTNLFDYASEIEANTGYIVQFPAYFDQSKVTFVSGINQVTLSNGKDITPTASYTLHSHGNTVNYQVDQSGGNNYYRYDADENKFLLVEDALTLPPFESVVSVYVPQNAPMRKVIGDGSQADVVTDINVAPANEAIIAEHYYNLQGVEIAGVRFIAPAQGEVFIKKTVYQSGTVSVSKIIGK
ncbi:MAG: hypothetical protein LBG77_00235 [Dysgonamonadaceae bacterium]|jgi:hypothetical protein|nr:hypothetical protein [Dysgonamonadaceae bacterium]